jgi:hypothetical protein
MISLESTIWRVTCDLLELMLVHTEKWTVQVQDPKLPPKPLSELIRPVGVGLSFALLGAPGSPVIISHIEHGSAAEAWYLMERKREGEGGREGGRGKGGGKRGKRKRSERESESEKKSRKALFENIGLFLAAGAWYFPLQCAACRAVFRLGALGLSTNP